MASGNCWLSTCGMFLTHPPPRFSCFNLLPSDWNISTLMICKNDVPRLVGVATTPATNSSALDTISLWLGLWCLWPSPEVLWLWDLTALHQQLCAGLRFHRKGWNLMKFDPTMDEAVGLVMCLMWCLQTILKSSNSSFAKSYCASARLDIVDCPVGLVWNDEERISQ